MNNFSLFDIVLIPFGIYIIYSVQRMKRTRVLASVFAGRNVEYEPESDIDGFIDYVSGKSVVMALIIIAGSLWNLLNTFIFQNVRLSIAVSAVSLVIIIVYVGMLGRARNKYLLLKKQ